MTGRYHLVGSRIVPHSGILARLHDYLLIQGKTLVGRTDTGHITGLSCILIYPEPSAPAPTLPSRTLPLGAYTCWKTGPAADPLAPAGTYVSDVKTTITFNGDGTYSKSGNLVSANWHQSANMIVFSIGVVCRAAPMTRAPSIPPGRPCRTRPRPRPSRATRWSSGTPCAKAATRRAREFSTADETNGTYCPPVSFFYCRR